MGGTPQRRRCSATPQMDFLRSHQTSHFQQFTLIVRIMFKVLFTPIRVGSMEIRNRIVMPAMHFLAAEGGRVLPRHIDYFAERARGGAGLIIIGGCTVDELSGPPEMISAGDDRFIAGLSELASTVKAHGAKIAGQLFHAGRYAHSSALGGRKPVSSSPVRSKLTGETPRELTIPEIQEIQQHFAAAARRLIQAGFDAVEVIASAGYLISQFLSPLVNRRSDPYGGSVENRMRFGIEMAGRIRREIGSHVPLSFRVAGNEFMEGGLGNREMQVFCRELEKAGVDMINVTGGWHETRVPQITMGLPRGGFIYLAQGIRQAVSIHVMASNRVCDPRLADQILRDGQADLIGFGRALIADPDLPRKALAGLGDDINFCIACNQGCFDPLFEGKPVTCLVNARAGAERETPLEPASRRKKVMVIGGGPAGLEVARVAALRGHEVSLYEKEETLGGQLHLAAIPPGREEFLTFLRYLGKQMQKLKVQVHTLTEVTPLQVEREKPEAVVIATGAEPFWPEIPGIHLPHVHLARDLLSGRVDAGKEVVVIGGGAVGLETALFLAQKGTLKPEALHFLMFNEAETPQTLQSLLYRGLKKITVVEMLPRMGMDLGRSTRWTILQDLSRFGVQMI
ncbi:MAG: FAD-dependent oxidoreductase, partial [Deltaproteobacteria bacterium]|nr:FAD-dependent oxidoreductase [Deltaproteobacteria bacterium]